jgi:hypothetical protein
MEKEDTTNGLKRIEIIRNQLASKKESIVFNSAKNPLNKWRKKSNVDKQIIEEMYYPFHRDLRDDVNKIMIQNPEFM